MSQYPIFAGDAVNILLPATEDPTFMFTGLPEIKFAASDFDRLQVKGNRVVFSSDLDRIRTTGIKYSTSVFSIKGTGILEFEWDHDTDKLNCGGKHPLINGAGLTGTWTLTVTIPASNAIPTLDPIKKYTGSYTVIGNLELSAKISL